MARFIAFGKNKKLEINPNKIKRVRVNSVKLLKKFVKRKDGTTAVEFSLIAAPFVFMLIGLLEMALMFASQSLLEGAAATSARLIRTGQIQQSGGNPQAEFEDILCDFAEPLIACEDLQYQVVSMDDFQSAENFPPASFDDDGNLEGQQFTPGGVSDVVLIRVAYRYQITTPMFQPVLTNNGDNTRTMLSTIVLQTEPYEFEDS